MDILYLCAVLVVMLGLQSPVWGAGKCKYIRQYKMLAADCYDKDFTEIPQNLNEDIEVLLAHQNRIRYISNSSLQRYTSLRFLYLGDNFIQKIEPGAFSELSNLEVLDLSINGIRNLPTDLPQPLRKLYLAGNTEMQNLSLSAAFNLAFLSLAGCNLKEIPAFGMLPNLKELNLTENPLTVVTPADLAPLCRLETLHLPPTLFHQPGGLTSQCQCHRLLTWTTQRYINLPAFNCTPLEDPDAASCDVDLSEEIKVYKTCLVAVPPTSSRTLIVAILICSLLTAFVVIICWWRKSRRKKNSVQDQRRTNKNTKAADTLIT